jgi:hypothetical protein
MAGNKGVAETALYFTHIVSRDAQLLPLLLGSADAIDPKDPTAYTKANIDANEANLFSQIAGGASTPPVPTAAAPAAPEDNTTPDTTDIVPEPTAAPAITAPVPAPAARAASTDTGGAPKTLGSTDTLTQYQKMYKNGNFTSDMTLAQADAESRRALNEKRANRPAIGW